MIIKDIEKIDIKAELSKRRSNNINEHNRRLSEVYEKLPEVEAIDQEISSASISMAKRRILKKESDAILAEEMDALKERTSQLTIKKVKLLRSAGYPDDYLETIYTCPICRDEGYADGKLCSCTRKLQVDELYKRSNLQKIFKLENFSTFSLDCYSDELTEGLKKSPRKNAELILADAKKYVNNFDERHGNILIYGETGLGKTFISNCIAKELLDSGHSVLYLSSNELFEQILSRFIMSRDKNTALTSIYEYIYNADLLIIDDLGTEVLSSFVKSQLFEIMNKRMLSSLSTIITTNLSLDEIRDRYTDRVMSRIAKEYSLYPLYGDDIRYIKNRRK